MGDTVAVIPACGGSAAIPRQNLLRVGAVTRRSPLSPPSEARRSFGVRPSFPATPRRPSWQRCTHSALAAECFSARADRAGVALSRVACVGNDLNDGCDARQNKPEGGTGMRVTVGSDHVSGGIPAFVLAESRLNCNGSIELAKQLIDVASDAGADAVTFLEDVGVAAHRVASTSVLGAA